MQKERVEENKPKDKIIKFKKINTKKKLNSFKKIFKPKMDKIRNNNELNEGVVQKEEYLVMSYQINDIGSYMNVIARANDESGKTFNISLMVTYGYSAYSILYGIPYTPTIEGPHIPNLVKQEFDPIVEKKATIVAIGIKADDLKKEMKCFYTLGISMWKKYGHFDKSKMFVDDTVINK